MLTRQSLTWGIVACMDSGVSQIQPHASFELSHKASRPPSARVVRVPLLPTSCIGYVLHICKLFIAEDYYHHKALWCRKCYTGIDLFCLQFCHRARYEGLTVIMSSEGKRRRGWSSLILLPFSPHGMLGRGIDGHLGICRRRKYSFPTSR